MSSIDTTDQLCTISGQCNVVETLSPPNRSTTMLEETIINSACSSLNNANNSFLSIIETPRRSMKKDVQSLVMSPSQDSINETVNNSELFIEMDTEKILTPKSKKKLHEMSGRRVVDIFTFIRDIQNELCDHGPLFGCSFKDMDIVSEKRCGLQSTICFKCKMCGLKKLIKTNNYESSGAINVNEAAIVGTLSAGGGYSHLSQICSGMEIPVMNFSSYRVYENKVTDNFEKVASIIMLNAAMEEKALAIQNGDIDKDGVPLLTVICDGSWGKRSYRTMYNSSSGTVSKIKIIKKVHICFKICSLFFTYNFRITNIFIFYIFFI